MRKFLADTFRQHFPALAENMVYLDSAATALKPRQVIEATQIFYQSAGTVHRSQHRTARQLTARYEQCRQQVAAFIGAASEQQIIWTRGATEAINLVAQSWLPAKLMPGEQILVSELEHHANLMPWLMQAKACGAEVIRWPLDKQGLPDMQLLPRLLTPRTRLLAITQMSNVTGAMPDLKTIIPMAHNAGVKVLVDGAQGVVHHPTDLQQLNPDFYVFSAHKLYGPTGLGILYAHADRLAEMFPVQGGGKIITKISFSDYQLQPAPWCFEPGTPNIAGVCGLSAALNFLEQQDRQAAERWTVDLAQEAEQRLSSLPGFRSFRQPGSPLLSFIIDGIHPADLATLLAENQVALRAGQHCAQPLMQALQITGTLRASFAPYNHRQDVDALVNAITQAYQLLTEEAL